MLSVTAISGVLCGIVAFVTIIGWVLGFLRAPPREMWVPLDFPKQSGLQEKIETQGYGVAWSGDTALEAALRTGATVVVERRKWGRRTIFRHKDSHHDLTLIKRKREDKQDS